MMTLHGAVEQRPAEAATLEDALRVHSGTMLDEVRSAVERASRSGAVVDLTPDTRVSGASWEAALGSLGAALAGARLVAEGEARNAFVATRPPGHHATPTTPMGFCLMNHVACTARWLQEAGHAERVLIVDWDVHHGNGTQDAFLEDPTVFFCSLHQWPHYPGTGPESERGVGAGEGFTLNVEIPAGTPRTRYLERFEEAMDRVFGSFRPDLVLVSAGFDCLAGDPLGDLLLEPDDLHAMTTDLVERARDVCGGRLVVCLEGGYDPGRTGTGVVAVIRALAGVEMSGGS
jgi:acetoin utilization deacetylase AcuC-like enzyme